MELDKTKVNGPFQKATKNLNTFGDNYMILYAMAGMLEILEKINESDPEVTDLLEKLMESNIKQISKFILKQNDGVWD